MSTNTTSGTTTSSKVRGGATALRIGLVLAAVLAVLQIQTGFAQVPDPLGFVAIVLPLVALVGCVFAWRGSRRAGMIVAVCSVLPALTGLPVYFIPDLPAGAIISASIGIVWSLVVSALILIPQRTKFPSSHILGRDESQGTR